MSEIDMGPIDPVSPGGDMTEPGGGFMHVEEKDDATPQTLSPASPTPAVLPISPQTMKRTGTAEHLAARRAVTPIDANDSTIKLRLNTLRIEITRIVTDLRWGSQDVDASTEKLTPLLDIGPVQQWKTTLIPFLFEIDRAGNLLPVWFKIIDIPELSQDTTYVETPIGRTRRYAILMLGNYKAADVTDRNKSLGFIKTGSSSQRKPELFKVLGELVLDPTTSLYATQSLVKQSTTQSLQVLASSLKDAKGWAKVDIVEALLSLKQPRFNDMLVASSFERVPGLESYVAIPIYKQVGLEGYLHGESGDLLAHQAALLIAHVLQESMTPPKPGSEELPPALESDLPAISRALFEGARRNPSWQYALALHALGGFLGLYWTETIRGAIQDTRIITPVQATAVMMNEIDPWMAGPGRDVLLQALTDASTADFPVIAKALGELRDPRAIAPLHARLESTQTLASREQAISLAAACDALARLGDYRSVDVMKQVVSRLVNIEHRIDIPKRRDNLPMGDSEIPASILYAAVVRACGQLGDRRALDMCLNATADFDPYVRTKAIEALQHLDSQGDDRRSRAAARAALDDPRESVARAACQLILQYRDPEAVPLLQRIVDAHNALSPTAYNALRQLT